MATAERFGFNTPTGITGAATASIPPADEIGDDLAVGSSAIGQGRVQATALQMAIVAATIGLRGRRPDVTLDPERWKVAPTHAATSAKVARQVEKLMLGVVRFGTGTVAAIPDVKVAGKTGTAELKSTQTCEPEPDNPESCLDQAAGRHDRHRRLVLVLRAGRQRPPAHRGRRPARRRRRRRRHRRAGRPPGAPRRALEELDVEVDGGLAVTVGRAR